MRLTYNSIAILLLFVSVWFSCEEEKDVSPITITTGRECGWCAGKDSLYITEKWSSYKFQECDRRNDIVRQTRTDRAVWNALINSLDWDSFSAIDVNTCAYCADGCDTWISIEIEGRKHRIRFIDDSPEIAPIHPFINVLKDWHEKVREL